MEEYKDYDDDHYYYLYDKLLFSFNITSPGVYILEFYNPEILNPFVVDNEFTMILPDQIIDTIDLSQKMYYNSIRLHTLRNTEPCMYIVKDLAKDACVYFAYGDYSSRYT